MSICQISKETTVNREYIAWVLQKIGIKKIRKRKEIEKEYEENLKEYKTNIIEWYKNGTSIKQIKIKLEEEKNFVTGYGTIANVLKDNKIIIKTAKDYNKKYSCDSNAFKEYDKYSCYWAGMLAADGCIYQRKDCDSRYLILALKDRSTIIRFKDYIKYTGGITFSERSFNKESTSKSPFWEVRCNSNEICDNLKENFNIVPKKTDIYTPPSTIPTELIKFYILGYIDGDGCISYCTTNTGRKQFNVNITGTHQMIQYIQEYFKKQNIKLHERHPENGVNNITLNLQGNDQLYGILSNLYSDNEINSICIQRKYERFLLLKEQQEKKYSLASA